MAILLSVRELSKTFGHRPLFEGLSFGLFDRERTGLIGPNGTGKSTLLKILAGLETPDSGEVSRRRGMRIGYLAQQDSLAEAPEGSTVRDELTRVLQGLGLEDYEVDMRVEAGLERLSTPGAVAFNPDQRVDQLSGGWRKRLAILSQVLREPDLLLLDEPTNHLDLEGVLWLEHFLTEIEGSLLVITHDRRFLEAVCNRMIELNKRYPEGHFSSVGNYSQFIENREALYEAQAAQEESTRNLVRREVEWLRRGPKARTTKQKARIDRAGELIVSLKELEFRNSQDRSATLDFTSRDRKSKRFIEAIHVEKTRGGRKLFGPLNLSLGPGDKLGLLGGNGSGKSTLLKILTGELTPDSGTIKRADALRIVTFDQHREQLDLTLPLRRALCSSGDFVHFKGNPIHIVGWAERFLFSKEQLDLPLNRLSGGEQSRVLIARLMLKPADILLLDEPTNDLDIASLEVLETSMLEFTGALVLVTHDRYLLDRVSQEILALNGRGKATYYADLAQWESLQEDDDVASPVPPVAPEPRQQRPVSSTTPPKRLSREESKELRQIEAQIRVAEKKRDEAKAAFEDPSVAANAGELAARHEALRTAQAAIDNLLPRWEELETRS